LQLTQSLKVGFALSDIALNRLLLAINPVPQGRFRHLKILRIDSESIALAINPVPQGRFRLEIKYWEYSVTLLQLTQFPKVGFAINATLIESKVKVFACN
jgi:hypothetical protein